MRFCCRHQRSLFDIQRTYDVSTHCCFYAVNEAYMVVLFVGINRTALHEIKLLQELRHPNIIGVGNRKVIERWDPQWTLPEL